MIVFMNFDSDKQQGIQFESGTRKFKPYVLYYLLLLMRVEEEDICAEDGVSGDRILSEYWWMTATVARDSWISFRDKMSMEASR